MKTLDITLIYIARATDANSYNYIYIGRTTRELAARKKEHLINALNNSPSSFHQKLLDIPLNQWEWRELERCATAEGAERERKIIENLRKATIENGLATVILNDTYIKCPSQSYINDQARSKKIQANRKGEVPINNLGNHFKQLSGTLKPIINLKTNKAYDSQAAAASGESISKTTIRHMCATGKKLPDGTQYAYLDYNNKPKITEGHKEAIPLGRLQYKVKEIMSGRVFDNVHAAAIAFKLSPSYVAECAKGKYGVAREKYVFVYLNRQGTEERRGKHERAITFLREKTQYKYITWPVEYSYIEAKQGEILAFFKTPAEIIQKLSIRNKSHIKAVCDGKRSHVEGWRIAYYNYQEGTPHLTSRHEEKSKKIERGVGSLTNELKIEHKFKNCTEAGKFFKVSASQIGYCAKGRSKSVRIENLETQKVERKRFAYINKSSGNAILMPKHREPLLQRCGTSSIMLINPSSEVKEKLKGQVLFSSITEYCRITGVPMKRALRYKKDRSVEMSGYEFIEI